jgi:hypothetical protein
MSEKTNIDVKGLNVYQRLANVRKRADFIQKADLRSEDSLKENKKGQGYKAVSSALVLMKVNESINNNGLILVTDLVSKIVTVEDYINSYGKNARNYITEIQTTMKWINIDDPKDTLIVNWGCNASNSSLSQSVGSAFTYNEKYFIMKFFNIATDELDPDVIKNNLSSKQEKEQERISTQDLAELKINKSTDLDDLKSIYNLYKDQVHDLIAFNKVVSNKKKDFEVKV